MSHPPHVGPPVVDPVAVFDLDKTLTLEDTSLPFLRAVAGSARVRRALVPAAVWGVPALAGVTVAELTSGSDGVGSVVGRWEGCLHERLVSRVLGGRRFADVAAEGVAFAQAVVAHGLRPDAQDRLERHRQQGHILVLASASLEIYVQPLAGLLGFRSCVGTRVEVVGDMVTGRFSGLPCWGREKLRRVRQLLGPGCEIVYAYGDGRGDESLLAAARNGVRVAAWR